MPSLPHVALSPLQHLAHCITEHGIGLMKREHLHCNRSAEELQLTYGIEKMLDPGNILNPNKIFSADKVA